MEGLFDLLKLAVMAVGIAAALLVFLFLWRAFKGRKSGKRGIGYTITASMTAALCLAVILLANSVLGAFGVTLDAVMIGGETPSAQEQLAKARKLAFAIAEEGMVLLENREGTLPLEKGQNVNLIGCGAYDPIYSGTGSGFVENADSIDLVTSLTDAGFVLNPDLLSAEALAPMEDPNAGQAMGFIEANYNKNEAPVSAYTGAISFENLKAFSDTAILSLGRRGSEGSDLPAEYVDLSEEEEALIQAAAENFEKVIVLINSANALDMQWVRDYEVDAVLWAGVPGPYGFEAVGRILSGEVNPSGRLVDTWVYDRDSSPVSENFGQQEASNCPGQYYVDYVEGIYQGYKWYETAYEEKAVITNTKTGEVFDFGKYEDVVCYPFGYGLSYTSFEEKLEGTLPAELAPDGKYTLQAEVTNTGDAAGKRAVQLYVTVPYTEYDRQAKVEKSAVTLVTYAKTDLLQPGESQTLTLDIDMEALASYDSTHDNGDGTFGSYLLDAGDYVFSLRSDAHTLVDMVTSSLPETHFFSGEEKRSSDQAEVFNRFADAARGEYLSRQDGFANYASAMASVKNVIEDTTAVETDNQYDPALDEGIPALAKGKDYEVKGDLTLEDLKGADYDDPRWEQLVSQMSVKELMTFTAETMYTSSAIASVKKPFTFDADGPLGLSSMFQKNLVSVAFPCVPLLAASMNTELAASMGRLVAELMQINHITSWYAPAMDLHRSPLSGRNYEYYSEDATVSAMVAAAETRAAVEGGAITFIKHFALNDMESQRPFVHTYANEQVIRENCLRPFEAAVKEGHANGVMTSMNFIGDTYAGAHMGLVTHVLRGEWGFVGTVLTDMDEGHQIHNYWTSLRSGIDYWLGYSGYVNKPRSDADIYYLQRAAKNHLWTLAGSSYQAAELKNWRGCVNGIFAELGLVALAALAGIVIRHARKKN